MPTNKDTPATPTAFSKTWLNTLTPQLPKQPETQEQAARMEIEGYAALHGPQPAICLETDESLRLRISVLGHLQPGRSKRCRD